MASVWSCGGGTQSAAIAALIVRGDLPNPDLAVIADTGREASETWRFVDHVLRPMLLNVGVRLHRIPHTYATVDLFSGADGKIIVIPMHSAQGGILPKYCSNEWKTRVVDRFVREQGLTDGKILIGFSTDEMQRMRRHDPKASWNHSYPLVERRMSRGDCVALAEATFFRTPPRSSCWMCPYRTDSEWLHLSKTDPRDFQASINLEKYLRRYDADAYLHKSKQPLDEVEFNETQTDMFQDQCASGMCFT